MYSLCTYKSTFIHVHQLYDASDCERYDFVYPLYHSLESLEVKHLQSLTRTKITRDLANPYCSTCSYRYMYLHPQTAPITTARHHHHQELTTYQNAKTPNNLLLHRRTLQEAQALTPLRPATKHPPLLPLPNRLSPALARIVVNQTNREGRKRRKSCARSCKRQKRHSRGFRGFKPPKRH